MTKQLAPEDPPTAQPVLASGASRSNALAALFAPPEAAAAQPETRKEETRTASGAEPTAPPRFPSLRPRPIGWLGVLHTASVLIRGFIHSPFDAIELTAWTGLGAIVLGLSWVDQAQPPVRAEEIAILR